MRKTAKQQKFLHSQGSRKDEIDETDAKNRPKKWTKRIFANDANSSRKNALRGEDAEAAYRAVKALWDVLFRVAHLTGLPPEPVARAVLGAMLRHRRHEDVQHWEVQHFGCRALHSLCRIFSALRATLQRDPSVLATVRAAAEVQPWLEKEHWYKELCVWLQPPCLVWTGALRGGTRRLVVLTWSHLSFYNSHFSH